MRLKLNTSKLFINKQAWIRMSSAFLASIILCATLSFAATSDSADLSINVSEVLTISSDGGSLSIASLLKNTVDSSQTSTLTLSSNSATGFRVLVDLDDLSSVAGQLCADSTPANGACDASGHVFNANNSPASYISFTSDAGTGGLTGTFTSADTNLGAAGGYQAFTGSVTANSETFDVHYKVYAQNISTNAPIYADTYKGTITFTIVAN